MVSKNIDFSQAITQKYSFCLCGFIMAVTNWNVKIKEPLLQNKYHQAWPLFDLQELINLVVVLCYGFLRPLGILHHAFHNRAIRSPINFPSHGKSIQPQLTAELLLFITYVHCIVQLIECAPGCVLLWVNFITATRSVAVDSVLGW